MTRRGWIVEVRGKAVTFAFGTKKVYVVPEDAKLELAGLLLKRDDLCPGMEVEVEIDRFVVRSVKIIGGV